mmetsp:Transcript_53746/g.166420  ORF Transcript_53746/g.166420 Transcript_53746/m.166420 type:complete len:382 (+) Transcript_53746:92-1237(+)
MGAGRRTSRPLAEQILARLDRLEQALAPAVLQLSASLSAFAPGLRVTSEPETAHTWNVNAPVFVPTSAPFAYVDELLGTAVSYQKNECFSHLKTSAFNQMYACIPEGRPEEEEEGPDAPEEVHGDCRVEEEERPREEEDLGPEMPGDVRGDCREEGRLLGVLPTAREAAGHDVFPHGSGLLGGSGGDAVRDDLPRDRGPQDGGDDEGEEGEEEGKYRHVINSKEFLDSLNVLAEPLGLQVRSMLASDAPPSVRSESEDSEDSEEDGRGVFVSVPRPLERSYDSEEEEVIEEEARLEDLRKAEDAEAALQVRQRLDDILRFVEALEAGHGSLPDPLRALAVAAARQTHDWLADRHPAAEAIERVTYLDNLMTKISKRLSLSA